MLLTYEQGLVNADPYIDTKKITLAHPQSQHQLLITEFDSYNANFEEFLSTEGRTIAGGLQLVGGGYPPPKQMSASCTMTTDQKDLFDYLKRLQDYSKIPITIQDRFEMVQYVPILMTLPNWLPGFPLTNTIGLDKGYASYLAWLDIDVNYATPSGNRWLVQFTGKYSDGIN